MKRLSTILVFLILIAALTAGCASIIEGEFETMRRHVAPPYVPEPVEHISVSDIDEFKAVLIELIMEHETEAQILYHHFGTENIQEVVELIAAHIRRNHPIAAYAVSNIEVTATRIITYYEVDVTIEYTRTQEELESIIRVNSEAHMRNRLLSAMQQHTEQALFQSTLQLTEETIAEKIKYIYYQNPSTIVMLPIVTVEMFPEVGSERIYSIQFSYMYDSDMMNQFSEILALYVERNAGRITGDTDSLKLLSLVRDLAASIDFDEGTAQTISVHGAQNFSATAYGALFRGRAVGEGFAMAFKALSSELRFENYIVLGYLGERIHAWNIVELDGYFYHIDVAMIAEYGEYGLERAFLKSDDEFEELGYVWDRENTVSCDGPLSFEDILALEEPDHYDGYDDESENGEGNAEDDATDDGSSNQTPTEPEGQPDNQAGEVPIDDTGEVPSEDPNERPDGDPQENQQTEED